MPTAVPYSGTIDVSPSLSPTPYRQVNAPLGAFGGGVAAATEHLGQVTESAAGEVFSRAAAMQEMKDNADAQAAISQYTQSIAEKQADYLTKQGKNAVDGLHPYLNDIESTRTQVGGTLTNPYSQQIYNEQTRFMSGRLSISAADHSAQQNKAYSTATRNANMQAIGNLAMADPGNYDQVFVGGQQMRQQAAADAVASGADPNDPITKLAVNQRVSTYYAGALTSLARTSPWAAQKQYDKVLKAGDLSGGDIAKVQDVITQQQHTVGARKIGEQVMGGADLSYGRGVVDLDRAKEAIGQFESTGKYWKVNKDTGALGKYQVMPANLPDWLHQAGLSNESPEQFLKDPAAQDKVFETIFGGYMNDSGSFNTAVVKWFGGPKADPNKVISDGNATSTDYLHDTNVTLAKSASLEEQQTHGARISEAFAPGDSDQAYFTAKQIDQMHNVAQASQRNTAIQNDFTVAGSISKAMENNQYPSFSDFMHDPKFASAYNDLDPKKKITYQEQIAKLSAGPQYATPPMQQQYAQLKGMSVQDPGEFLKLGASGVLSQNLPWEMRKELLGTMDGVYKQAQTDPSITNALRVLEPTMSAANIDKDHKDVLNQYTGQLMDILKQQTVLAGRPLKNDEIKTFGTQLLQNYVQANIFHGGPRVPLSTGAYSSSGGDMNKRMFQVDVPPGAAAIIKNDPKWAAQGITPTNQDIQNIYAVNLFNALHYPEPARAGIGHE